MKLVVDDNSLWATPLTGSSWVAPHKRDGERNAQTGFYTYTYTFCPALVSQTPYLSLNVLADNAFDALLNGTSFDPTPYLNYGWLMPFQVPQTVATSVNFSTTTKNELQMSVENGPQASPTGLDLAGYVEGVESTCQDHQGRGSSFGFSPASSYLRRCPPVRPVIPWVETNRYLL